MIALSGWLKTGGPLIPLFDVARRIRLAALGRLYCLHRAQELVVAAAPFGREVTLLLLRVADFEMIRAGPKLCSREDRVGVAPLDGCRPGRP